MRSVQVRHFTEPSELAAAFRGPDVEVATISRGRFTAEFTSIELGAMRLQRLSASLPLIYHSANMGGRSDFLLLTKPGLSIYRNGSEIMSDKLVRRREEAQSYFHRSSGPMDWGSISLRLGDMSSVGDAVLGFDLTPPRNEQIITPRPDAMAALRRLHAAAGSVAAQAPEVIRNSEGARGVEQVLLQALVACLVDHDAHEQTRAERHHQKIMQRFYAVMEAKSTEPLYMLEIAVAVGASLRSLTVCCQEHLGMGPKKYLMLRRMHLARKALLQADAILTVTDVATQYGFWQFGRFAVQYRTIFGESPSVTLRGASGRRS